MLASELWAAAHGVRCTGPDQCHWCSAPCERAVPHDDPPPMIGVRRTPCLRPANGYVCVGCQLFRRKRLTVNFLGGGFRDGRTPQDHSWLVTQSDVLGVDGRSGRALYEVLLSPPPRFLLSLLDDPPLGPQTPNLLQLMVCNDFAKIEADTPLVFTVNGVRHYYTVYELEESMYGEAAGPGVRALDRLFPLPRRVRAEPKRERGRPSPKEDGKITKRVVYASGNAVG